MKIKIDVEKPEEPQYDNCYFIKVTIAKYYIVPAKGKHTAINGWPINTVVSDWFEHHDINRRHVTRDSSHISGGDIVESSEIISEEEYTQQRSARLERERAKNARECAQKTSWFFIENVADEGDEGDGRGTDDPQDR
jgi:hypothetical protein